MSVDTYLNLIIPEHRNKPKFIAWLTTALSMIQNAQTLLTNMYTYFNIDTAVGAQLDILGQKLGTSRIVPWQVSIRSSDVPPFVWGEPAEGEGGWDEGYWQPPAPSSILNDNYYRTMLKAVIAKSHFDGTIPSLETLLSNVLAGTNISFVIDDTQDMGFTVTFNGTYTAMLRDLIAHDTIIPRPEGIALNIELTNGAVILNGGNSATTDYDLLIYGGSAVPQDWPRTYKYTG